MASTPPTSVEDDVYLRHAQLIIAAMTADPELDTTPHRRFHTDPDQVEVLEPYSGGGGEAMSVTSDAINAILAGGTGTALTDEHAPTESVEKVAAELDPIPPVQLPVGGADQALETGDLSAPEMTVEGAVDGAAAAVDPSALLPGSIPSEPGGDAATVWGQQNLEPGGGPGFIDDNDESDQDGTTVGGLDPEGGDGDGDELGGAAAATATTPVGAVDHTIIPVGGLGEIDDTEDRVIYDPSSVGQTKPDAQDDLPESARFDVEPGTPGVLSRIVSYCDEHRKHVALGGVGVLAVVALLAVTLMGGSGSSDVPTTTIATSAPAVAAGDHPSTAPAPESQDIQIPITRTESRCPSGSSNPKAAFDNEMNTAWVCVRSSGTDGQVLRVYFSAPYVITSIAIVPGFNSANSSGEDQWLKYRSVTRVKYAFNDTDRTVTEQATNNTRNEVATPLKPPVLASMVRITILQTTAPTGGDEADEGNPAGKGQSKRDAFAVSSITILGHKPS